MKAVTVGTIYDFFPIEAYDGLGADEWKVSTTIEAGCHEEYLHLA
jgi:hypothetical protein